MSRVGRRWDRVVPGRVNWWSSPKCQAHYNAAVCGEPVTGSSEGCRKRLARAFPGRVFDRAISVGCGAGAKEMAYVTDGLVGHFDLWELAPGRIEAGRTNAERLGIADHVSYHLGDVFKTARNPKYDLVHWDHSLHHMPDVDAALAWSAKVLKPGGVVLINDYIGPNRLQWTRDEVDLANAFLERAGTSAMRIPYSNFITYLKMRHRDPSEAPQSERIMAACAEHLRGSDIAPIGGTLLDILGGVVIPRVEDDDPIVDALLTADLQAREAGYAHFAFGLWAAP